MKRDTEYNFFWTIYEWISDLELKIFDKSWLKLVKVAKFCFKFQKIATGCPKLSKNTNVSQKFPMIAKSCQTKLLKLPKMTKVAK